MLTWSFVGALRSVTRSPMALPVAYEIQGACWFSILLRFGMAPFSSAKIMSAFVSSFVGLRGIYDRRPR